ncbi:uncharacterized protein BDW43DRAFT_279541 [Aspergillus alliaceus]|uniref:uncharacterized protein n=1 Tax=Petromyces alliaceus TaxID=209559 RepID=UPI0012A4EC30|nr:uncharacterized protein BDW43DRAFT_279541 [Aspergillus alliaceus]KAB8232501.1 hypothetical protein BDW43DRAFT_279541 [Aspergillus alliaceus]
MFKVTGDVIKSCQESTRCGCYVGPVDIVCIMTVFKQTAVCFDFIAKSGFDGTVKVGIGNYCFSRTDEASLKRILVLGLVKQADELLDSVSVLVHNMLVAQSEPGGQGHEPFPYLLEPAQLRLCPRSHCKLQEAFPFDLGVFRRERFG